MLTCANKYLKKQADIMHSFFYEIINYKVEMSVEEELTIKESRRRVTSVVEHSSANPKVPGSIPSPVSYRGHGL